MDTELTSAPEVIVPPNDGKSAGDILVSGLSRYQEQSDEYAKQHSPEEKAPEQDTHREDLDTPAPKESKAAKPQADEQTNGSTLATKTKGQAPKSRYQERVSELTDKIKGLEASVADRDRQLAERQAASSKSDEKKEPKHRVPPPQKPQYEREQLLNLKRQYRAANDWDSVDLIDEELRKLDKYPHEYATWELKEGRETERYQQEQAYHENEAVKKWPEMRNAGSPIFQQYQALIKRVPEILERADGKYIAAAVADTYLRAARVDPLEQKLKEAQDRIAQLEGKAAPVKQTQATSVGGNNDRMNASDMLTSRLGIR